PRFPPGQLLQRPCRVARESFSSRPERMYQFFVDGTSAVARPSCRSWYKRVPAATTSERGVLRITFPVRASIWTSPTSSEMLDAAKTNCQQNSRLTVGYRAVHNRKGDNLGGRFAHPSVDSVLCLQTRDLPEVPQVTSDQRRLITVPHAPTRPPAGGPAAFAAL